MTVGGWNQWHQPYLLDVVLDNTLTPGAFVLKMLTMARRYSCEAILIEDDGSLAGMEVLWRKEMQRLGYHLPVVLVKLNPHEGKENRWISLQEYTSHGGVHLADGISERTRVEIRDQWERAPNATHDDFLDAFYLQTLHLPPGFASAASEKFRDALKPEDARSAEELVGPVAVKNRALMWGTLASSFPNVYSLRGEDPPEEWERDLVDEMEQSIR
jgi:hypothetical protein